MRDQSIGVSEASVQDPVFRFMQSLSALEYALAYARQPRPRRRPGPDLTGSERMALLLIDRNPGIALGPLAALLYRKRPEVRAVVGRLEQAGLVERRQGTRLMVTERGDAAINGSI